MYSTYMYWRTVHLFSSLVKSGFPMQTHLFSAASMTVNRRCLQQVIRSKTQEMPHQASLFHFSFCMRDTSVTLPRMIDIKKYYQLQHNLRSQGDRHQHICKYPQMTCFFKHLSFMHMSSTRNRLSV